MPSPVRNTARISENVYVVAPNCSDKTLVHITSLASAVRPEIAIATYTERTPFSVLALVTAGATLCGVRPASHRPMDATRMLKPIATRVAVVMSNMRSR